MATTIDVDKIDVTLVQQKKRAALQHILGRSRWPSPNHLADDFDPREPLQYYWDK